MPDSLTNENRRLVSITIITFRHRWHVYGALRRWRSLNKELLSTGHMLDSRPAPNWSRRRLTFTTFAADAETLRRAAASTSHVATVRWTIPRCVSVWSAVFTLSGWSSMSGAYSGVWSDREARLGR